MRRPALLLALVLSLVALSYLLGSPPYVLGFSAEYLTRFMTFTFSAMLVVWAADSSAEMWLPCVWTTPLGGPVVPEV